jgi:hypothetical protein
MIKITMNTSRNRSFIADSTVEYLYNHPCWINSLLIAIHIDGSTTFLLIPPQIISQRNQSR